MSDTLPARTVVPTEHRSSLIRGLAEPFGDIDRIAVLRGGGLGDLLVVEPAIRALANAYPHAGITLLGTPAHANLLCGPRGSVTSVEGLPAAHGVRDGKEDPATTRAFLSRMRRAGYDLAVQLHGGGRFSNPFVLELSARHTVGMATPDAVSLERTLPYHYYQHEVLRALEVVGLAGAAPVSLEPRVDATPDEFERGARFAPAGEDPLLAIHPGASDPRRRWPISHFADVARLAVQGGARVVVVGDHSDRETAQSIVDAARGDLSHSEHARIVSLAGCLSLSDLVGLFANTDVMLGNDSGPGHLARAVGTATVSVYWIGNVINAGPLTRGRHRVHLSWTTHCPVCGRDATQATIPRCEHDVSFVAGVSVQAVVEDVADLLARARSSQGNGLAQGNSLT